MIDHLVYATPNLEATVDEIARRWGVRATPGGKHAGRGTHNALISFGDGSYLELIGPDPEQPDPPGGRAFGIDTLTEPRLVTWAVKAPGIETRVAGARAAGFDPGEPQAMSRVRPSGEELSWRLTRNGPGDWLVPFLIDWGETTHPSTTSVGGCRLLSLRAVHPRPVEIRAMLGALGEELAVEDGPAPGLVAVIDTARGTVELR